MSEARTVEQPGSFPNEHCEFLLRGPAGLLECAVDLPDPAEERPATVIICHPHPEHGGTMHNKVVTITERSMRELGLRTVRFNFRGTGESEGQFDDGYGETDDLGINVAENPVHVHDFQATLLHLLGIDHERFTYRFQGRQFRLTDVHGKLITDLLA